MSKVLIASIGNNPHRDLGNYPISEQKVEALVESIKDTEFWDNILCRPAEGLAADYKEGDAVQLAYGHHRLEALRRLNVVDVEIPVKDIDDTIMLKTMCNENKGDWASNMSVILETVRQVKATIIGQVADSKDYKDYKAKGYSLYKTADSFKQAVAQGVGVKKVRDFLGDTWAENDLRNANRVLECVEKGFYGQDEIIAMPSIGLLGRFSALAEAIHLGEGAAETWPNYFKTSIISEIAAICCDPDASTTVKTLTNAAKNFKDKDSLSDPLHYIKTGNKKELDIVKATKKLVYGDDATLSINDLDNTDGFSDYTDLAGLKESVTASIKKSEEALRRQVAGEEPEVDGEDKLDPMSLEGGDLEKVIADAEGAVDPGKDVVAGIDGSIDVPEVGDEHAIGYLTDLFSRSAETFGVQMNLLIGRSDEVDDDDTDYITALNEAFGTMVNLMTDTFGEEEVKRVIKEIMG